MKLHQLILKNVLQGNYFTEAASSPINDGCQPYYFLFTLENGAVHRYPETHHFNTFSEGACANDKCSSTAAGNSGAIFTPPSFTLTPTHFSVLTRQEKKEGTW
jgi:hypothetical protein